MPRRRAFWIRKSWRKRVSSKRCTRAASSKAPLPEASRIASLGRPLVSSRGARAGGGGGEEGGRELEGHRREEARDRVRGEPEARGRHEHEPLDLAGAE